MQENFEMEKNASNVMNLPKRELPSLKQILRQDQDVRDFYTLVAEHDLRSKALELIEKRLSLNHQK